MSESNRHPNANELLHALSAELEAGQITLDEMRARLKADAERPVDHDMLREFCDAYEQRVQVCSGMLQTIVEIASDCRNPETWRERESEVDRCVARMTEKMPLWTEQVRAVSEFLAELRAESGQGPVQVGNVSSATAHLLASRVLDLAAQAWESAKQIAHRSQTDPTYTSTATAPQLFLDVHIDKLPKPNDIMAVLQLERVSAIKLLREQQPGSRKQPPHLVEVHAHAVTMATEKTARQAAAEAQPKKRAQRAVVEPLVWQHLLRRPHDTATEVAEAAQCSTGMVVSTPGWQLNQQRLKVARKLGIDPKAIKLNECSITQAGSAPGSQLRHHRAQIEQLDTEIDAREESLYQQIAEYQRAHPEATAQQVAAALRDAGCTPGDVERRQALLNRLAAEQADDALEDQDEDDPESKRGTRRKWVRKRP